MSLATAFLALILGITLPTATHKYIRARKQPLNKQGFIALAIIALFTYLGTVEAIRSLPEGNSLAQLFIITYIAVSGGIAISD